MAAHSDSPPAPAAGLHGSLAWITGGGSGMGRAAALELAAAGATVVISGRDMAKLVAVQASAPATLRPRLHALALDVSDRAAVAAAAAEIEHRFGGVGLLVNSAGINLPRRRWDDCDAAAFDQVLNVNLHGAVYCQKAVLAGMRARGRGTVINVCSHAGWHVTAGPGAAYTASKAAMIAMTRHFNAEQGPHGLRATALCPGDTATPILDHRPVPPGPEARARMLQGADLGRTIRFLAELPPHVVIDELVITPLPPRAA